jgi:hypothetical protein
MEQVIWVEILSRRRDVAARFRFTGSEVRIGRGYHNDVIVDDPYVASGHVRLFRDEVGRLVAEDIGTENGIFVDRDRTRHQRIVIDGERPIRIGRTDVRIREANHLVPRERTGRPERHTLPVVLAVALGLVNLGLEAASLWSAETVEPRVSYYLWPLLAVAMVMTTWVSIWAFLSRVLSGRAHFGRNLVIALSGLLAVLLFNELARFCAFALSWSAPVAYAYVALTAIIALVCFFHLREVSPLRLKLKGAAVATLFTLIVGAQVLKQSEAFQDSGPQITLPRLLPPALRLVPVQNENAFFAVIEQLKTKLDDDRTGGDKLGW